jgi:hypothetical protein
MTPNSFCSGLEWQFFRGEWVSTSKRKASLPKRRKGVVLNRLAFGSHLVFDRAESEKQAKTRPSAGVYVVSLVDGDSLVDQGCVEPPFESSHAR